MGLVRCTDRFKYLLKEMQSPTCFLKTLPCIVDVLRLANHSLEHKVTLEGNSWTVVPLYLLCLEGELLMVS